MSVEKTDGTVQHRPSMSGGAPARERALRKQGRDTMRRLLDAGRTAFSEMSYHQVRVADVVKIAKTSHGTFYLYFSNKEDLFKALARDAMHDVEELAERFPMVLPSPAGHAALRSWIQEYGDLYATHSAVIRLLTQPDTVGEDLWTDGIDILGKLSKAMTTAMADAGRDAHSAELTALSCLMMIERMNFVQSLRHLITLERDEVTDKLTDITFAAFLSTPMR
ncbi:TetR/AcrR family transcriptional regulator [Actinocorallia longicatena]